MSEVAVLHTRDHMEAETAAAALRAAKLHPRVALDDTLGFAAGLTTNSGRRIIFVPTREAPQARFILGAPRVDESGDQPLVRFVLIVGFIVAALFGSLAAARVCYGV